MTRMLRRCCEDPEPATPSKVSRFRKREAGLAPAARTGRGRGSGAAAPAPPASASEGDADLPLPIIPPGLNEGFGLW